MLTGKQDAACWKEYYLMKFEIFSRAEDDLSVLNKFCHELIKSINAEPIWKGFDYPAYKAEVEGLKQAISEIELEI